MGAQLTITDGTDSVSLLNSSGISLHIDRYNPGNVVEGEDTIEPFTAMLKGTSHDNLASQAQTLNKLLRKAAQYNQKRWQNTPVYMIAQTGDESNARYALLKSGEFKPTESPYQRPFLSQNYWLNIEISVTRSGHWSSHAPAAMPSASTVGNGIPLGFSDMGGAYNRLFAGEFAALAGSFGGAVRVDGAGTESYWIDATPSDETTFVFETKIGLSDLVMGSSDIFSFFLAEMDAGTDVIYLYLSYDGSNYKIAAVAQLDSGNDATSSYTVSDGDTVKVIWSASTGAGNDDGSLELVIAGTSKETLSSLDNDTLEVDKYKVGAESGLDADTIGFLYLDDIRWADADDGVWHNEIDFEGASYLTIGSNFTPNYPINHIYNYDATAAAFSSNYAGESGWNAFEVSGSTPASGDMIYFGSTHGAFYTVEFLSGTAGDLAGYTFTPEYWDGSNWVAEVGIEWNPTTANFYGMLNFSNLTRDWQKTTINSVNAYWLRIRITALTSWTTSPVISQPAVSVHTNHIEVPSSEVNGDYLAKLLMRLRYYALYTHNGIGQVMIGAKSRGLKTFVPQLWPGGDNPPGWSVTLGTDTSQVTANGFPNDQAPQCTFATDQTVKERVKLTLSGESRSDDFEGTYRLFVQCLSSAAGVTAQAAVSYYGVGQYGEYVYFDNSTGNYLRTLDMGRFDIKSEHLRGDEGNRDIYLDISLLFGATSSTPNVTVFSVILLPIDEFSSVYTWQSLSNQLVGTGHFIQIDSGVLRKGAHRGSFRQSSDVRILTDEWAVRGELPTLEPQKNYRIYVFPFSYNDTTALYAPDMGLGSHAGLFHVDRWKHLRGSD